MNEDIDLLLKYPLISCKKENGYVHYTGRVLCQNFDLNVDIIEENVNNKPQFRLQTNLSDKIPDSLLNITSNSITDYLDQILEIFKEKNQFVAKNYTSLYRKILNEYSEFTGFYLNIQKSEISPDLSKVKISVTDDGNRVHSLEIRIDLNAPKEIFFPDNLNFPEKIINEFPTSAIYMTELYSKFTGIIEDLQDFFNIMDDLDHQCCILDPEKPTRKDTHRRIWIDHNLSLTVTLDPLNVKSRPELKFLGPERLVDSYLDKLREKLEDWDPGADLVQVLLDILGLEAFPQKPEQNRIVLADVGECCICFSARLNDKLPEIICENKSCENFYHVECLREWLISLNSKKIFNQLHGQCPNCEKKICCPISEN